MPASEVIVEDRLGEGAFGEVFKGIIKGPLHNPKISSVLKQTIGIPVAIKLLKRESYVKPCSWNSLTFYGDLDFKLQSKIVTNTQCLQSFSKLLVHLQRELLVMQLQWFSMCSDSLGKGEGRLSGGDWHDEEDSRGLQPTHCEHGGMCHPTGATVSHNWVCSLWRPPQFPPLQQEEGEEDFLFLPWMFLLSESSKDNQHARYTEVATIARFMKERTKRY